MPSGARATPAPPAGALSETAPSAQRNALPALGVACLIALASIAGAAALPGRPSPLVVALLVGLVVANVLPRVADLSDEGAAGIAAWLLRIGIVLLGARGSVDLVASVGPTGLIVVALTMTSIAAVVGAVAVAGRIPPSLALLIGVGTAICGNTAVAAIAPLIGARRSEIAFAIGTITVFGTLALLVYPIVGRGLGLSDVAFGLWAGAGIHDTAQVVATGFAYSPAAGEVATVVKLARNALLLPILVVLPIVWRGAAGGRLDRRVLWLLAAYLGLVVVNSLGFIPPALGAQIATASTIVLAVGLAAVGLSVRLSEVRGIGRGAAITGFVASLVGGAVALAAAMTLSG